ncbi:radical SAM protein [Dissulfurirhabdus thermomarina]|uniref:Radical SAM protein n=1 Tax=Dissulfurirhabdus thermomarina TaxID=1765737 RepID=A0A6N9TNM2_DISTH|nr:radical SAM protein [Dissulfurirhabdus thermomarina]NDY42030.1 radical SAM protein [Dissulfurirhabdus thermomarina]NMX23055.1 radical SAM protein [Dissulfurirhabdus thermomarina]
MNREPRREQGAVRKTWAGRVSIALIFPNTYAVGMANLGLQAVYRLLNRHDGLAAERVFRPPGGPSAPWISEESGRPLADFDLVLFSLSFEADYPGVPAALRASGIAPRAAERGGAAPLVLAGGVAAMINPEPVAPFLDAVLLGEFEAQSEVFARLAPHLANRDLSREERLHRLRADVPGTYVPALYRPRWTRDGRFAGFAPGAGIPIPVVPARADPGAGAAPATRVRSPDAAFGDMHMVELARGCGRGCRFCAAGFVYRPPRPWPAAAIRAALDARAEAGRVGLVGLEFLGRREVEEICEGLLREGISLGFSSLRADAVTPRFARLLAASGARVATLAPEAGSERLRRVLNKNLSEADLLRAADALAGAGIPNLKLYLMLGLPTETEADVRAAADLVERIREVLLAHGRRRGRLGRITVTAASFVPKAWTPFQWAAFDPGGCLARHRRLLSRLVGPIPNVRLRLDSMREARLQAVLSRGDRRLAPVLERVAGGQAFAKALSAEGLRADLYTRERSRDEPFPWEIAGHGVRRAYLLAEWDRAHREKSTPFCRPAGCSRCGACGDRPGGVRGRP